jgi:hypothetical protein
VHVAVPSWVSGGLIDSSVSELENDSGGPPIVSARLKVPGKERRRAGEAGSAIMENRQVFLFFLVDR